MGYPTRDNRSSHRPPRRPEFHKAICSSCGKECDLPFKPTGDRPVYCRDCFARNGGNKNETPHQDNRSFNRPPTFQRFENTQQSRAFVSPPQPPYSTQLAEISAKLDQMIRLMSPASTPSVDASMQVTPEAEKKKPEVTKSKVVVEEVKAPKKKAIKKTSKTSL